MAHNIWVIGDWCDQLCACTPLQIVAIRQRVLNFPLGLIGGNFSIACMNAHLTLIVETPSSITSRQYWLAPVQPMSGMTFRVFRLGSHRINFIHVIACD